MWSEWALGVDGCGEMLRGSDMKPVAAGQAPGHLQSLSIIGRRQGVDGQRRKGGTKGLA